ncbi:hypothetical protein GHT06_018370 [Daphnia sinensis]|uniref:C2H2-type domain-containing protein n=1 Tax=Daphnia sinensis TaxID=1820382 RepID=A0AAD5PS87_9CRUS|nr:hypothetical protein GHT06_018370 [Daphnia sinensis]
MQHDCKKNNHFCSCVRRRSCSAQCNTIKSLLRREMAPCVLRCLRGLGMAYNFWVSLDRSGILSFSPEVGNKYIFYAGDQCVDAEVPSTTMKVHRRGASSPSLLLEASEPPTSVNVNDNYYQFELEPHHVERGKRGQKIFVCDLCPAPGGVFKRSFSLKRHYLRFHINFAFLSPRDVNNCAIAVAGQHQRSGFPASGPNDRLINRLNNPSPLLFRCHHCGRLLRTKNDLLKHLESHGGPSQAVTADLVNGDRQQGGTNRCPRCSTAFSLRKTLLRHVKKNQCRGGYQSPTEVPNSKPESETGLQSGETSEAGDDFLAISPAEESEEMDMETSLKLGCPAPVFRFACTLCSKMFNSYINMCRHRRVAHGRYGICSPGWLLSRKLSGKPTLHQSTLSPMLSSGNQINSQDLLYVVPNANENLNRFLDGKGIHIRSVTPADDRFDVDASDADPPPPQRWSWGKTNYGVSDVHKLDVPIQMAYFNGLQSWKSQEIAKTDGNLSQAVPEELDISKALNLLPAKTMPTIKEETATRQPEFSGEWIRKKRYICSPCGEIFHDFLALLDHQQKSHNGVWCTHIQLDQSIEVDLAGELTRQITRSGTGGLNLTSNTYQCTKCQFVVESIPELHSHILLCSNHVSASPSRKRRLKVNPSSRRNHWNQSETKNGRSRGMQRTISSQTKNSSATRSLRSRSPKEDAVDKEATGVLRRSARRVLSFSEPPPPKKKKGIVTKRLLRQRVSLQPANASVTPMRPHNDSKKKTALIVASSTPKSATGLHECDGCQKQFQSHTSVLKHKHYCPKKVIESMEGLAQISAPEKKQNSVTPKVQTKKLIQDSVKVKNNVGSSSNKRKSDVLPSSPVNDSKCAAYTRINGIHPTISNAQKKKPTSFPSPAMPSQVLSTKSPVKSTMLKKDSGSIKSHRKTTKNGSVKKGRETEETPVASEKRPVRSSRKVSMVLVMEDQVEASFLEALSPEQRVRVTEQRCPFCSKHYVYRSNFKRHLLEGCDAIDEDELSANLSSMINKNGKQTDAISSSSELKVYKKEKRSLPLVDSKIVGNKSKKKAVEQPERNVAEERINKKAKIVVKKNDNVSNSKSAKLQEPKKLTENRTPREAVTKIELARKSARDSKQLPRIEKVLEYQQQKKGKSSGTQEDTCEKKKSMDISKNKKKNIGKPSSDILGFPKNTSKKTNMKLSSSLSLTNKKSVKSNPDVSSQDEGKHPISVAIEDLLEPTSNGVREGEDQKQTFLTEKESEKILTKGETIDSEATTFGYKSICTIDDCTTSSTSATDCTIEDDQPASKAITSNCSESHALDRLQLGQALEKAIKSGIFKSYSRLTKYPSRMRHLEDMAQAYLQSTL